jgi:COMPASS component SWD3
MRVYDRGIIAPYTNYNLTHALKGFKSKNWPIKHSFYKIGDNLNLKKLLMGSSSPDLKENEEKDVYALLATGSADSFVYVYGIGFDGSSELVQKLEGHGDRVYAVDFHPVECVIASASADFTVNIWSMNSRKRNK